MEVKEEIRKGIGQKSTAKDLHRVGVNAEKQTPSTKTTQARPAYNPATWTWRLWSRQRLPQQPLTESLYPEEPWERPPEEHHLILSGAPLWYCPRLPSPLWRWTVERRSRNPKEQTQCEQVEAGRWICLFFFKTKQKQPDDAADQQEEQCCDFRSATYINNGTPSKVF